MGEAAIVRSVWICEWSGQQPIDGVCSVHGGDRCIARYDHYGVSVVDRHAPEDCTYRCPVSGHEVLAFRDERHVVVPSDEYRDLLDEGL